MRTRTVADAAAADGRAVVRVVSIGDQSVEPLLADRPYPSFIAECEDEAVALADSTRPDAMVFDTTTLSPRAFSRLTDGRIGASLSPVFDRLPDTEFLFHRARTHPLGSRPAWYFGSEWAVVRPECTPISGARYAEAIDPGRPLSVAICMGGGDAPNRTREVLERLREVETPMLLWVLLGEGYPHSGDELVAAARADRRHEVILARTTDSMWRILSECSVAILAGGTVTYEAAAAGLPSINLLLAPEQRWLVSDLVDAGAAFAPDDETMSGMLDETVHLLRGFDADRRRLLAAREAAGDLVDGRAAERICDVLIDEIAARRPMPLEAFTAAMTRVAG